jgi:hypothetical protein
MYTIILYSFCARGSELDCRFSRLEDLQEKMPGMPLSICHRGAIRQFKCPLCNKVFTCLEHQTRHIRTHTREKPYACQFPGCTKRFLQLDEVKRHLRTHNNSKLRKSNKKQQAPNGGIKGNLMAQMMPPPTKTRPVPTSTVGLHSFATYATNVPSALYSRNLGGYSLDLLATVATKVKQESNTPSSQSHNEYNHSTALSTPTPYDSLSPTPVYNPLATPAHSSHLGLCDSYKLPVMRSQGLQPTPPHPIIEPQYINGQYPTNDHATLASQGWTIKGIILSTYNAPKVAKTSAGENREVDEAARSQMEQVKRVELWQKSLLVGSRS